MCVLSSQIHLLLSMQVISVFDKERTCIIPFSYKIHLSMAHSIQSIFTSSEVHLSLPWLFYSNPIKSCSILWTQPMWWQTPMVKRQRSRLVIIHWVKSLPFWTPWLIIHSQFPQWIQVMSVFGSSLHTLSISRGTYDIVTIITMLNVSDALFEIVYSGKMYFESITSSWFFL